METATEDNQKESADTANVSNTASVSIKKIYFT